MNAQALASAVVAGIATGSILALIAYGFVLVFSTTNVFNFAQGDLVTLGAILGYGLFVIAGAPALASLAGAILLVAAIGALEWFVFVAPVSRRGQTLAWLVTTLAFSTIVENVLVLVWPSDQYRTLPWPFGNLTLHVLGIQIGPAYIGAFAAALVVAIGLELAYGRTLWGKAMLAIAEDREAASLRGIRVGAFAAASFIVGAALSAFAGFIVAPSAFVSISLGPNLALYTFVAMAIGGFSNHRGALVGGLIYGLVQALAGLFVNAAYVDLIGLVLLVTVLTLFPQGVFRSRALRSL